LWALMGAIAYALSALFARIAVRDYPIDSMLASSLRALPTLLFALYMSWRITRGGQGSNPRLSDWRVSGLLVAYGLLTFVVGNPLLFRALALGGVLVATPVSGTQSLWAALMAFFILHQVLNGKMIAGMLISIAGIGMLAIGQSGGEPASPQWLLAVPLALGTAVSWALSGVLMSSVLQQGVNRFNALAVVTGTGVLALNLFLAVSGKLEAYLTTPVGIQGAVLIAGLFNAWALVSITTSLTHTTVATTTTISSLQIALAPLLAWMLLGERMDGLTAFGIVLVSVGAIVVQRGGDGGKMREAAAQDICRTMTGD